MSSELKKQRCWCTSELNQAASDRHNSSSNLKNTRLGEVASLDVRNVIIKSLKLLTPIVRPMGCTSLTIKMMHHYVLGDLENFPGLKELLPQPVRLTKHISHMSYHLANTHPNVVYYVNSKAGKVSRHAVNVFKGKISNSSEPLKYSPSYH